MIVSSNWRTALRDYLTTVAVVHCRFGDLLIALATLALALILVGHRDRPARRFTQVAALTLFFGFGYTIFSEWLNVIVRKSWAYSGLMAVGIPISRMHLVHAMWRPARTSDA